MARARIDDTAGRDAVHAVLAATEHPVPHVAGVTPPGAGASPAPHPDRTVTALAVRYLLQVLADASPGKSVEVRVPPWGAVQIVEGPRHTRGTPPNVVELDPASFIALATGGLDWATAVAEGRVHASGARSDISAHFPLAY